MQICASFLIYLLCSNITCSASPIHPFEILVSRASNLTTLTPNAWVPEPNGRGTSSLLHACFITLSLCAWTAVHPNIPARKSDFHFTLNRIGLLLVAIFFPELILYCAWDQWWAARCLRNEINRLGEGSKSPALKRNFVTSNISECAVCSDKESTIIDWDASNTDRLGTEQSNDPQLGTDSDSANVNKAANNAVDAANNVCGDTQLGTEHESASTNQGTINTDDTNHEQDTDTQLGANLALGIVSNSVEFDDAHEFVKTNEAICEGKQSFIPWTSEQAFFVVSGGLAIDSSSFSETPALKLTPEGLVLLAELDLFPDLSKTDVEARSKADIIAKALSSLQILWFFIQCLARVTQRLPLTLLEVHTMIQVMCGLAIYGIWLRKAYAVTTPIICNDPRIIHMAALLALREERERSGYFNDHNAWVGARNPAYLDEDGDYEDPNTGTTRTYSHRPDSCSTRNIIAIDPSHHETIGPPTQAEDIEKQAENAKLQTHQTLANNALTYLRSKNLHFTYYRHPVASHSEKPPFRPTYIDYHDRSNFLVRSTSNFHVKGAFRSSFAYKKPHGILRNSACIFSLLYGASHLSAWGFQFPTDVEMWLWRASGIVMAVTPVLAAVLFLFRPPESRLRRLKETVREVAEGGEGEKGWGVRWLMGAVGVGLRGVGGVTLVLLVGKVYPIARLFFLVESLVALRKPAEGTYEDVAWAKYFPQAF